MKKVIVGILFVAVVAVLVFLFESGSARQPIKSDIVSIQTHQYSTTTLKIAGQTLNIDLAQTPDEREQGLSGRKSLADGTGMLFVFENSGLYGFWMKDMLFPIDIIWVNEEKNIVHIEKSLTPETYPKVFGQEVVSKYVLEVQSGFSDKNRIKIGDKVDF